MSYTTVAEIQTIRLEIVRQGPAQNQLISPLTPYIALCNDRGAETFHLPMEHGAYLDDFLAMSDVQRKAGIYEKSGEPLRALVERQQRDMTAVFGSLRSLQSEMAQSGHCNRLLHLRLVLSAWELAALPFELSNAPSFFPGEGEPMVLSTAPRIVITRESRRSQHCAVRWPDRPSILFAWAGDPEDVPVVAHRAAIYNAVRPFIGWNRDQPVDLDTHVHELAGASLESLSKAVRSKHYSHVHLLAHGGQSADSPAHRLSYVVHLQPTRAHDGRVSGEQLALALVSDGTTPTVVTLATCDSASVGSVIAGGGGIAHALHHAGIPLVVASQFPLTKRGSAVMAQVLYEGFLQGTDPRECLHRVRENLANEVPGSFDWASIVAYGELANDLESLRTVRLKMACDAAVYRVTGPQDGVSDHDPEKEFDYALSRLIARRGAVDPRDAAAIDGQIASLLLRWIEAIWWSLDRKVIADLLHQPMPGESSGIATHGEPRLTRMSPATLFRKASEHYGRVFDTRPEWLWALTQHLLLRRILELVDESVAPRAEEITTLRELSRRALALKPLSIDAVMGELIADLLDMRSIAAPSAPVHDVAARVIRACDGDVQDFRAFRERSVFRRIAWWFSDKDKGARERAQGVYDRLGELGVQEEWIEQEN